MHIHNQLSTLQDLANDYPNKSLQDVLDIALDKHIFPVIASNENWLVVATSWVQSQPHKKLPSPLGPRTGALHIGGVKCLEIGRSECMQILKDGNAIIRFFEAVHVLSGNSQDLSRIAAQDFVRPFNDIPKQNQIPILFPCFAAFNGPADKSDVIVDRYVQDLDPISYVVHISHLKFTLKDEKRLRSLLGVKSTVLQIPNGSGPHISPTLAQLLKVLEEFHFSMQGHDSSSAHKKSTRDIEQDLHKRLLDKDKDKDVWQSETLRQCAVRLIYPRSSSRGRSKKMDPYNADGISSKLAKLLQVLKTEHEAMRNYDHDQHVSFLIRVLPTNKSDAARITSIIRLVKSARGGRRQTKTQPESPAV